MHDDERVVWVCRENAREAVEELIRDVQLATFVSMSVGSSCAELNIGELGKEREGESDSGLERWTRCLRMVQNSAILEWTLSTFRRTPPSTIAVHSEMDERTQFQSGAALYRVKTYRVFFVPREGHAFSVQSPEALVGRGLNISMSFAQGIQYCVALDDEEVERRNFPERDSPGPVWRRSFHSFFRSKEPIRWPGARERGIPMAEGTGADILQALIESTVPLVTHDSFAAASLLMHSFHTPIPQHLFAPTSKAEICRWLQPLKRLYDTKYIAHTHFGDTKTELDELASRYGRVVVGESVRRGGRHISRASTTRYGWDKREVKLSAKDLLQSDIFDEFDASQVCGVESVLTDAFDSPGVSAHGGLMIRPRSFESNSFDDRTSSPSSSTLVEKLCKLVQDQSIRRSVSYLTLDDLLGPEKSMEGTCRQSLQIGFVFASYVERIGLDPVNRLFEGCLWSGENDDATSLSQFGSPKGIEISDGSSFPFDDQALRTSYLFRLGIQRSPEVPRLEMISTMLIDRLVDSFIPSPHQQEERKETFHYVASIVKRSLGSQVFAFGGFALNTCLESSVLDISAFVVGQAREGCIWCNRLMTSLCDESVKPETPIRISNISFSSWQQEPVVIFRTGASLPVRISINRVNAMMQDCLVEHVDRLIGRNHTFKRGLLLVQAWAQYNIKFGTNPFRSTSESFRSGWELLTLAIVNMYHSSLHSPLHLFKVFLEVYSKTNWEEYGISLKGFVRLSDFQALKETDRNLLLDDKALDVLSGCASCKRHPRRPRLDREAGTIVAFDVWDGEVNLFAGLTVNESVAITGYLVDTVQLMKNFLGNPSPKTLEKLLGPAMRAHITKWKEGNRSLGRLIERSLSIAVDPSDLGMSGVDYNRPLIHMASISEFRNDPLAVDLTTLRNNLEYVRFVSDGATSEVGLLAFLTEVLAESGTLLIGEIGQHLRDALGDNEWGKILKEQFGGLKKFLVGHPELFFVDDDHPLNPHVYLTNSSSSKGISPGPSALVTANSKKDVKRRRQKALHVDEVSLGQAG
uniref:PAP/OAS1 substrate-binding-related domain-containing protein n=1 Tax=Compsopogon caeruleus TaxID=31354 RepID=A0A7S1X9E5_9RHOD|mmetsp:Transcript_10760/g.21592  ORF Transcript_10760/g.21592 Transcript_10760/m.21592 type:complete len:1034 (+) Transcript_10760:104-3205(+)